MKMLPYSSGFTLLELVTTIAILGIVMMLAMPDADEILGNNRLSTGGNDMVAAMQFARSEAIGANAAATLCKSNSDYTNCTTSGGWHQGWIIFTDPDRDANVDTGEEILQIHDDLHDSITIYGTSGVTDAITFRASGNTSISSTQVMVLCDARGFGDDAKGLVISILGRASLLPAASTGQTTCLVPES